jgi:hypothetical protein
MPCQYGAIPYKEESFRQLLGRFQDLPEISFLFLSDFFKLWSPNRNLLSDHQEFLCREICLQAKILNLQTKRFFASRRKPARRLRIQDMLFQVY